MILVGLTGGTGCGATTVAILLKKSGFEIITADEISQKLYRPNSIAYRMLVRSFGKAILDRNNEINRSALASAVFSSKQSLSRLNSIALPLIKKEIKVRINALEKQKIKIAVLDAPLLLEAKMSGAVDFIVVVAADLNNRVNRLVERDFLLQEEAIKRINSQIPLEKKIAIADFVIDNNGTIQETEKQVQSLITKLKKRVKK